MASPRTPKGRTREVARRLAEVYPDAICELDHRNAFELLAATILSAQTTDARVNMVTPDAVRARTRRRRRWLPRIRPPSRRSSARPASTRTRRRASSAWPRRWSIASTARCRPTLDDLVTLPGVGRKTGNVVRSVGFGLPGLPVDTHVGRLSKRLGLTTLDDPVKVELELNSYLPGRSGDRSACA